MQVPVFDDQIQQQLKSLLPHTASVKNPIDVTFAIDSPSLFLEKLPKIVFSSDDIHGLLLYGLFDPAIFSMYSEETGIKLPLSLSKT